MSTIPSTEYHAASLWNWKKQTNNSTNTICFPKCNQDYIFPPTQQKTIFNIFYSQYTVLNAAKQITIRTVRFILHQTLAQKRDFIIFLSRCGFSNHHDKALTGWFF